MTKSQNTKKEQQKDLCITSEQLTEQWKKGELPSGWYYVKIIPDFEYPDDIAFYTGGYFELYSDEDIEQVLAPLPSYEEWDKLNNACHELEKETACLTVDIVKLKELLKECRRPVCWYVDIFKNKAELLTKIDEVLK